MNKPTLPPGRICKEHQTDPDDKVTGTVALVATVIVALAVALGVLIGTLLS